MKINKSVEQAVYVIAILALQEGHTSVKSHIISEILRVSDSYLKKILIKLSRAGLIQSNASKTGGYQLSRNVEEISLRDIFFALELHSDVIEFKHLSHAIFDDEEHVREGEDKILNVLNRGLDSFYNELDKFKISELLHKEAYEKGVIEWEKEIQLKK